MSFLIFFVALSLMIFAHELGHFLLAKKRGVKVEEFGFGYPPRLFGKRIGETIYSLNLIPMGGFVRVWGMEQRVKTEKKRAFYNQSKKAQGLILIGGVIMNFLVAVMVFGTIYGIKGVPQATGKVKIVEVEPNSPADKVGVGKDTVVVSIENKGLVIEIKESEELVKAVENWAGQEVTLRAEDGKEFKITPRKETPEGEGSLGVIISDSELVKLPLWQRIPLGVWYGFKEGIFWGEKIIIGVTEMLLGLFKGKPPADIAGPIGIYKVSSDIYQESGFLSVIHFFAVVSVNLVVVNLLPLPGTDGWHISLLIFEKIKGKAISEETKRKVNQVGMIILLTLFFLILFADIKRFLL